MFILSGLTIRNPFGFSRSSSLHNSLSQNTPDIADPQNRPSFQILWTGTLQKDFHRPIAYISPDFVSRRRKPNPGPIRREKSPYCTVFSEFPGFWVIRNFRLLSNRPIIAPFGKRSPDYRTPPFPRLYSPEGDILRQVPSVDRQIRIGFPGGFRIAVFILKPRSVLKIKIMD